MKEEGEEEEALLSLLGPWISTRSPENVGLKSDTATMHP